MSFRNKLLIIFLVIMWVSFTGILFVDNIISNSVMIIEIAVIYFVLVFIISVIFANSIAAEISRPIKELTNSAKLIAAGDYTTHMKINANGDFCELARAHDLMRKKLLDDRKRLGRKLHDSIAQTLTIACLKLDFLMSQGVPEKFKELKEISKILRGSMEDTRNILRELEIPEMERNDSWKILEEK